VALCFAEQAIQTPQKHRYPAHFGAMHQMLACKLQSPCNARSAINRYISFALQAFRLLNDMESLSSDVFKLMVSTFMCECKTTVENIFPLRKP
jgi:hypothetical protein